MRTPSSPPGFRGTRRFHKLFFVVLYVQQQTAAKFERFRRSSKGMNLVNKRCSENSMQWNQLSRPTSQAGWSLHRVSTSTGSNGGEIVEKGKFGPIEECTRKDSARMEISRGVPLGVPSAKRTSVGARGEKVGRTAAWYGMRQGKRT